MAHTLPAARSATNITAERMNTIFIDTTTSTNTLLASMAETVEAPTMLYTRCQSAGRGQRGNSWEAEPSANITCSVLLRPRSIEAARQFVISEAVALAVASVTQDLLPGYIVTVKWPNDIYVGDRKICGILIENAINGSKIIRSIAGIGLNVNQQRFTSSAPNPVSVCQLTGKCHPLQPVLAELAKAIEYYICMAETTPEEVHAAYRSRLWRGEGTYLWRDTATDRVFKASIIDILPDGPIVMRTTEGETLTFAFKEVAPVITLNNNANPINLPC